MRYQGLIVGLAIPALLLVGCAGPRGERGATAPGSAGGSSASEPGDSSSSESGGGGGSASAGPAAGPVDVCALLSDNDAIDVAKNAPLVSADSVIYTIKREKQTAGPEAFKPPLGDCKFYFYSQMSDASSPSISATVQIQATDASDFGIYKSGTPVSGVGDEAYKSTGSTVVRKGNVMLSAGENSATDDFVVAMYKKMVPNLQ
jgi:hypothetical protein